MPAKTIRVALADDHPLVVTALRDCLQRTPGFQVKCECTNGSELIGALAQNPVDVAVTDFSMGHGDTSLDGFNLLRRLGRLYPETRIVIVSAQTNPGVVIRAMKLGARAFVSKEDELDEIVRACIHVTVSNGNFYSPSIRAVLDSAASTAPTTELTLRELEVVRLYAQGFQLSEIASKLGRSVSTISSQKTVAMRKLNVQTNTDLIRYAYENGLI
ncbi:MULTISPECIES: response regulator transcription factor [unclassified Cupriavidus]|jgi:two-component system capsular synthesis response regulator RcsB|uniref:response regulator transcription factor n=1 Tax=unclassified Cupriavidus TaxID=2640874 RepID=UPI001C00483E|nr:MULTISPECIES: response regulator transcription factor [unclassified Cupriavidus]MCA3183528.1 response regulator transcription factor [Cupriavidus sp.]MCA3188812.1 response regulator transcription factor [Cupriavidus sp.]MCA3198532.1 response regulator transcription factor [Cupriavidus sp.]MCA3201278.1 response regulator transcription factor [Cupriavidus sp.]MCA3206352.1 response regulator transcription factor [Cupriavidus sp.]